MIAFLVFTLICMFWIWPLLLSAITERQNEIKKSLDDAAKAQWFPIDSLPDLAFDHAEILADALKMI